MVDQVKRLVVLFFLLAGSAHAQTLIGPCMNGGPCVPSTLGPVGSLSLTGAGTALSVTNGATFGSLGAASGNNITFNLGGNGHTLTIAGTGGTGNPGIWTASTTAPLLDLQSGTGPGTELKTAWILANPSQTQMTLSGTFSVNKSPLSVQFVPSGTPTATSGGYQYTLWSTPSDTAQAGSTNTVAMATFQQNVGCSAATATATGTISGTTLTVSGVTGTIAIGQTGWGTGVASFNITGGSGTSWTINQSQSVGPVSMRFCQSFTGFRTAVKFASQQISPSGNGFGASVIQGGQASGDSSFNEGGTALNIAGASGANYAWDEYARLHAGATNYYVNKGKEIDLLIESGASALKNLGMDVVLLATHGVQGTYEDHAYGVDAQGGSAVGFKTFFDISGFDSQDPGGSNTTVLNWEVSAGPSSREPQALAGINLTVPAISGCAYSSDSFCMKRSNGLQVYGGLISAVSGGVTFDTTGYEITYSSIASGTCASCVNGDWYQDSASGLTVEATVVGGTVTAAVQKHAGWETSAPGGAVTVTNMNPDRTSQTFTVNVSSAQQVNMNLGTTNATAIGVGNSGSTTTFAGAIKFPALGTAGAVSPSFTTAPTGCSSVVWVGPFTAGAQANIYLAGCHT